MAIITISRQMGSGGIPIAQQVAEELGYTWSMVMQSKKSHQIMT